MRIRLALLILVTLLFVPTIQLRKSTYGTVPAMEGGDESWRSLTDLGLLFSTTWYQENPLRLGFILQMNPSSVELRGWRMAYASYPPAFVVPPYLASLILHKPPTIELLMNISLLAHLILALTMGLITFELAATAEGEPLQCFLLGATASAMILYFPAALLFFQNIWWPDLAGLPFFGLALYLERKRKYPKIQLAVLSIGFLTDWFNLVLGAAIIVKRIILKEDRNWKDSSLPILSSMSIFLAAMALYEHHHSSLGALFNKVKERTGALNEDGSTWIDFFTGYWGRSFFKHYGSAGLAILALLTLLPLIYIFLRSRRSVARIPTFEILFLATTPMIFHAFLLRQHYYHHPYNNLKYVIPFSLLPVTLFASLNTLARRSTLSALFAIGSSAIFLFLLFPRFEDLNQQNKNVPPEDLAGGIFLRQNTTYRDIVFSSDKPFDPKIPSFRARSELVSIAYKNAWQAADISAIKDALWKFYFRETSLPPHRIDVFGLRSNEEKYRYWKQFSTEPETVSSDGRYYLLAIDDKFCSPND